MLPSTKTHSKCQNCGKITTDRFIRVMGDAMVLYLCKNCRSTIKRLSHIVWITVFACIIAFILFMCYCYRFPAQIENMFKFFEKSFGR
jgi:hypothetical protein